MGLVMDRRKDRSLWRKAPLEEKLDRKLVYARWTTQNVCHEDCLDKTLDDIFDLLNELKKNRTPDVYVAIKHAAIARLSEMGFMGIAEDLEWKEMEWQCFP